jgi:hypothetical protein
LSLFATLIDEVLLQDPDLEAVRFEILDFSVPPLGGKRGLIVTDAREIPRMTELHKREMLRIFAEGYFAALAELTKGPATGDDEGDSAGVRDPRQPDLL